MTFLYMSNGLSGIEMKNPDIIHNSTTDSKDSKSDSQSTPTFILAFLVEYLV